MEIEYQHLKIAITRNEAITIFKALKFAAFENIRTGTNINENSYIIRNNLRNTKSGKIKCEKSGTSVANWPCFKS